MVWILPLLSQHKVTWPSGRIVSLPYVLILLLVREIFTSGNTSLSRLMGMVLHVDAESICAFTTFVFSPCMRCKWAKNFLAGCEGVSQSTTNASSPLSSSTKFDCCCRPCRLAPPLQTRAKWPEIPHFPHLLPNAGQCCWRGCWWLPPHQKHCDNCCTGFRFCRGFANADLLVKFTCSCCVFLAVFMSWFANTVASNVLATSTTSRSVTFVWAVFLCLCPFPISFTRRVSDVKPAINWSLISSSAKSSYSHCAAWLRTRVSQEAIDSFSFCSKRRNFCRSPDTPTLAP